MAEKTTSFRDCELCGRSSPGRLYEIGEHSIVRCGSCGLVFVGDPPEESGLPGLYDEDYWETPECTGYAGYAAAEARKRPHFRTLLDEVQKHISPPGSLLEVGCAYGYFLAEARERGWEVQGVEPSPHAARCARELLGPRVHEGTLESLPTSDTHLDVVVLWDVIEHLSHPLRTLEEASSRLRPGGVLAMSTGDFASLASRIHGRDWSLLTPPWHLFYFSGKTLGEMTRRAGLEVIRVGGDGIVGVDPESARPRLPGWLRGLLLGPTPTRLFRVLGLGMTLFLYARKPS